ncbi:MAG: alpha-ketoglutarate-dependent dioxygenase AlkB [Gemmatimonadaceae bacterium]|nr:alpha-ketoglutarate-dependent dioxygenase AlkB [Gemmatimonadaceae bacterium]
MADQFDLFSGTASSAKRQAPFPDGFRYQEHVISEGEEASLVRELQALTFTPFKFHEYTGKRRVHAFGWSYDFALEQVRKVDDMPDFLQGIRDRVAQFAGLAAATLQQVLVTEYAPGAGIGWHRDKGVFDQIVGLSLSAPCVFRLRRATGASWERINVPVAARSAYLLSGASRTAWEHSIPPVDALRYSLTFRSMRER